MFSQFVGWVINRFSYTQIYVMVCLFLSFSLVPFGAYWIRNHFLLIENIDYEIKTLDSETVMRQLFDQVLQHRMLSHLYLSEELDSKTELLTLETQINATMQYLLSQHNQYRRNISPPARLVMPVQKFNHLRFQKQWNRLVKNLFNIASDSSDQQHTLILQDFEEEFNAVERRDVSYGIADLGSHYLIGSFIVDIPYFQEELSLLALISYKIARLGIVTPAQKEMLHFLMEAIQDRFKLVVDRLNNFTESQDEQSNRELLKAFYAYQSSSEEMLRFVDKEVLEAKAITLAPADVAELSRGNLEAGFKLWDDIFLRFQSILQKEKDDAIFQMWLMMSISLGIMITAFLIGFAIARDVSRRLGVLIKATQSFSEGAHSVRVPVVYHDQVGRLNLSFNNMAQTLESMLINLKHLVDATTKMSNGNLSVRLAHNHDQQFAWVALSFNKMAQTFETIISRIQQLGILLTASATEVAAASNEQVTATAEQETATHQIAQAAKEIAESASRYALTMGELGAVAEETSELALEGKDSLNKMGTIMRQMVDASGNIATKLAILNEKAGNITTVITTITKVADQTNLLSLNASIEAEKAGEYGRSFAVIAREIRRLADQTAMATLDIEKIVNEMMRAVATSVMGVDDFGQEIRHGAEQVDAVSGQLAIIIEQVQAFTGRFETVIEGMQAQFTGAEQINHSILLLSQTARPISESIHHFQKTIQELDGTANELRNLASALVSRP